MTPLLTGNWNYPTRIWSGPGRIGDLAEACVFLMNEYLNDETINIII